MLYILEKNNKLHDYYNGQSDLNESKICFIGEIEDRIKEDYLRIYRYFRFRGLFNLPKTSLNDQKIVEKYIHESLAVLTNDVIRQEILKMFNMSFPLNCFYISHQTLQKFKWVEIVQEHFIRTKYDLGLNKCLNKIDNLIN
jgi:tRNA nucleotidyltransferase/poly(A) polymerase